MKTLLLLALLILPSLLFAQDEPVATEPTETFSASFDAKCYDELTYAISLIRVRIEGMTLDLVITDMEVQRNYGSLQKYSPELISYMIDIVLIVYNAEDVTTAASSFDALKSVEALCLRANDDPPPPKKKNLST